MKKLSFRKPAYMDIGHMRLLHLEAMEQLELMQTSLHAAEQRTDPTSDILDEISTNHWNSYLDIVHMICMHDGEMNKAIKQTELADERIAVDSPGEDKLSIHRLPVATLINALLRRHKRIEHVFTMRGDPMAEYRQNSLALERKHVALLISLVQNLL